MLRDLDIDLQNTVIVSFPEVYWRKVEARGFTPLELWVFVNINEFLIIVP